MAFRYASVTKPSPPAGFAFHVSEEDTEFPNRTRYPHVVCNASAISGRGAELFSYKSRGPSFSSDIAVHLPPFAEFRSEFIVDWKQRVDVR